MNESGGMSIKANGQVYKVFKRKDGVLSTIVYDYKQDKRIYVYSKDVIKLKQKIEQTFNNIVLGINKEDEANELFENYASSYLLIFKYGKIKQSSFDSLENMLFRHVFPRIGKFRLRDISATMLQCLINDIAKNHARSTCRRVYDTFAPIFKYAHASGIISINPAALIVLPREEYMVKQSKDIRPYSVEEIARLKQTIIDLYEQKHFYRIAPIFIFLANTGLRIGEALALSCEDVNLDERYVRIKHNLVRVKERNADGSTNNTTHYEVMGPKSKSSKRIVELNTNAYWALKEILRRYEIDQVPDNENFFFRTKDGDSYSQSTIRIMLQRICVRADVEYKGLHNFRHYFATRLLYSNSDVNIVTISELLGHSDCSITQQVYLHAVNEEKRHAVELLEMI